jgi:hypothetical protein
LNRAVALDFVTLGVLPMKIIAGQAIGSLLAVVIAVFSGTMIYTE